MAKADAKKVDVTRKVMRCTCAHEFQDQQYGKGMRLFKHVKHDRGMFSKEEDRCTVCFSRPYSFGGHGSVKITPDWRVKHWPSWLPLFVNPRSMATRVLKTHDEVLSARG